MHKHLLLLLLALVALGSVSGCGGGPTPVEDYSVYNIDIDDPASIARWEESELNINNEKVVVVRLRYFGETLGGSAVGEPTRVILYVEQAATNDVAPEQQKAIDELVRDEAAIHSLVRDAVYEHYQSNYDSIVKNLELAMLMFGGSQNDVTQMAPKILRGDELDSIMRASIRVHPVFAGKVSLGITFTTPWSDDDMGLRVADGKIVTIGNAYEAFFIPPPGGDDSSN